MAVDGIRIPSATALIEMVNGSKGESITISLVRDNQKLEIPIRPVMDESSKRYVVGIYPGLSVPTILVKRGVLGAMNKSVEKNAESATLVFKTLSGIILGKIKLKAKNSKKNAARINILCLNIKII